MRLTYFLMNRVISIIAAILFSAATAFAQVPYGSRGGAVRQTRPRAFNEDLGFTVGVNVPMYDGVGSDATVGLTYGHFYYNGLGFRTGIQYSPSVAELDNVVGIPVAFAFKTRSRELGDRFVTGLDGAHTYLQDNYYDEEPFGELLAVFLVNLISNAEFSAGITPGFIVGDSSSESTIWHSGGFWEKEWVERPDRLSLSLDAGVCLNYSIWRFDIKLMPAFHYNLTKNYVWHRSYGNTMATGTKDSSQVLRWFFSFSGGLSFRF